MEEQTDLGAGGSCSGLLSGIRTSFEPLPEPGLRPKTMMSGSRQYLHGVLRMIGNTNTQEPRWTWIPSRPSWPCMARTPPGMRTRSPACCTTRWYGRHRRAMQHRSRWDSAGPRTPGRRAGRMTSIAKPSWHSWHTTLPGSSEAPGNEFRTVTAEGNVVVVEHRLSATLPNGRPYVNDYCFVYEVRDGKVRRIREYMDTRGGWAQVFGEDEPAQLIEFAGGPVRTT